MNRSEKQSSKAAELSNLSDKKKKKSFPPQKISNPTSLLLLNSTISSLQHLSDSKLAKVIYLRQRNLPRSAVEGWETEFHGDEVKRTSL